LAALERSIELDPANISQYGVIQAVYRLMRRPVEQLATFDSIISRSGAPIARVDRARTLFAHTGRIEDLRRALDEYGARIEPDLRLGAEFLHLGAEGRYQELKGVLDATALKTLRVSPVSIRLFGNLRRAPNTPIEEPRGWVGLLLGDRDYAAAQGRAVLAFAASERAAGVDESSLKVLEAEGFLFSDDAARARDAAREAMALAAGTGLAERNPTAGAAARIYAWTGAYAEAMDLLEQLAVVDAGLMPAEITRDPTFTVPLAEHPRYRALAERLEAQMAASTLR
jgi:hypothetical protein